MSIWSWLLSLSKDQCRRSQLRHHTVWTRAPLLPVTDWHGSLHQRQAYRNRVAVVPQKFVGQMPRRGLQKVMPSPSRSYCCWNGVEASEKRLTWLGTRLPQGKTNEEEEDTITDPVHKHSSSKTSTTRVRGYKNSFQRTPRQTITRICISFTTS